MPIPKEQQDSILATIKTFVGGDHKNKKTKEEQQRLLVLGACIALDKDAPPHWVINLQCGRTDRLFS